MSRGAEDRWTLAGYKEAAGRESSRQNSSWKYRPHRENKNLVTSVIFSSVHPRNGVVPDGQHLVNL